MVLSASEQDVQSAVKEIFAIIRGLGNSDYLGEPVSQLEHCLQCAALAQASNADNETVVAALLHDIGRFIPAAHKMPRYQENDQYLGRGSHDVLGERYLRHLGFSEKVCQLVGAHVSSKRYLCATEQEYWSMLTPTSKKTLEYQGGIFNDRQVLEGQKDPWLLEKLALRRWDDLAKVANAKTPPLEAYEEITFECLRDARSSITLHSRKYALPKRPTVVICIGGFSSSQLKHGILSGNLPILGDMMNNGFHVTAQATQPSPGVQSDEPLLYGAPPLSCDYSYDAILNRLGDANTQGHGIQNHGPTILSLLSQRGLRITAITEEDSPLLRGNINQGIYVCAQNPSDLLAGNSIDTESNSWAKNLTHAKKSDNISLHVLDAGLQIIKDTYPDVLYLCISRFSGSQDPFAKKGSDIAMQRAIDFRIGHIREQGATVAVTGYLDQSNGEETDVPIIVSQPVRRVEAASTRNWYQHDVFDLILN